LGRNWALYSGRCERSDIRTWRVAEFGQKLGIVLRKM
jgi:hypothetical protein